MKLYVCTDHDYHWPVGVASVVLARDINHAINLLDEQLIANGLQSYEDEPYTLVKVPQTKPVAMVLQSGNY